ncbi:endonuclease Q family protein [Candidatus Aenigmatarchaeota archaeon]
MQVADLHIHSKYSRATSKYMDLPGIVKGAKIKGLDIIGTGDFLHPVWLKELKEKLSFSNGIYEYSNVKFVLTGEVSLMYKQDGRGRRVHHVIFAPSFDVLDQIIEFFSKKGRLDYDGRPIFGFSSIELVDEIKKISKDIEIIPAHIWTPWFSLFGSMSGFDSIKECFAEKSKHIHAIETGLSSDPAMNWLLSQLDDITLISNSDSHSAHPHRLGRESNVFDLSAVNYKNIIEAIRTRKDFLYTIEVDPNYGKYHYDGHRKCNFSCSPAESLRLKNICPKCNHNLTIGVLNRIEHLADRSSPKKPKDAPEYKSLLPLMEIISSVMNVGLFTKKSMEIFNLLIDRFDNELNILLSTQENELKKVVDQRIVKAIIDNRKGKIKVTPGYDGEYGIPVFDSIDKDKKQTGLNRFI